VLSQRAGDEWWSIFYSQRRDWIASGKTAKSPEDGVKTANSS
jgi:hypothetical protein